MKIAHLDDMVKGWFIGDFAPVLHQTSDVEVAVKRYRSGETEAAHYHKIATEITVITQGEVKMNGKRYASGDIVVLAPGDITDFLAVTDAVTTVVKIPSAKQDKYIV